MDGEYLSRCRLRSLEVNDWGSLERYGEDWEAKTKRRSKASCEATEALYEIKRLAKVWYPKNDFNWRCPDLALVSFVGELRRSYELVSQRLANGETQLCDRERLYAWIGRLGQVESLMQRL